MIMIFGLTVICLTLSCVGGMYLHHPTFVSDWQTLIAQDDQLSYLEIPHNLGELPAFVDVQVKAIDGANKDFVFPGIGNGERDDDFYSDQYGGVVYVYNSSVVKVVAPNSYNGYQGGKAIYTSNDEYWSGVNGQASSEVKVRVRCWATQHLPVPHFQASDVRMESGTGLDAVTYVELQHHLDVYPVLAKVRIQMTDGLYSGFYYDAQGANSLSYTSMTFNSNAGGTKFAYNEKSVRVWTSSYGDSFGFMFDILDGWGQSAIYDIYSRRGLLEVLLWRDLVVDTAFETRIPIGPSVVGEQLEVPLSIIDNVGNTSVSSVNDFFISVTAEAVDGPNAGYRFQGLGSAIVNTNRPDSMCAYGGLVYGFSSNTLRLWRPNHSTGSVICISTFMGNSSNIQASQAAIVDVKVWIFPKNGLSEYAYFYLYMSDFDMTSDVQLGSTTTHTTTISCSNECRVFPGCLTFTFNANTGGVCKLFGDFSHSDIVASEGTEIWRVQ